MEKDIAIIGTGFSAAVLAYRLRRSDPGVNLTLFEKSRGIGGRLATRYSDTHEFDHGGQYFTARTPTFQDFLAPFIEAGHVAEWKPRVMTIATGRKPFRRLWYEPHYVSTPRMNSLCKALLATESPTLGTEITKAESRPEGVYLVTSDQTRFGPYGRVISTAPATQTARILASAANPPFDDVSFEPGFALMASLSPEVAKPNYDAAVVREDVINWLAFNETKPGRHSSPSLVAHTDSSWARANLESAPEDLAPQLIAAVARITGLDEADLNDVSVHRWRFARTGRALGQPFWEDRGQRLAACGDWCLGDRIEDAFLSASAMAHAIIEAQPIRSIG